MGLESAAQLKITTSSILPLKNLFLLGFDDFPIHKSAEGGIVLKTVPPLFRIESLC